MTVQKAHARDIAGFLAKRLDGRYVDLLPREERVPPLPADLVAGRRVLVTGAEGFLGQRLGERLDEMGADTYLTDLHDLDVTDATVVGRTLRQLVPDAVIHLAAMKHAPLGEFHPRETTITNVEGTYNVITASQEAGVKPGSLVFVSTCKAAAPETVYGATKLLGERLALGAGYAAVRLGNVLGSSESVLETWLAQDQNGEALTVTPCERYWLTPAEAVGLILAPLALGPGLYHLDAGDPEPVVQLAQRFRPGAEIVHIPPRRGDRLVERFRADGEHARATPLGAVVQVFESWDQVDEPAAEAS